MSRLYAILLLEISHRTQWWCLKCMIMYLARDIPAFAMYCIYGESDSSLLIQSTDSGYDSEINIQYTTCIYVYIIISMNTIPCTIQVTTAKPIVGMHLTKQ